MLDFKTRNAEPESAFPDMTPMIDCVFQLLIFFLLASSFSLPALQLNLPSATADGMAPDSGLVISVAADRQVAVNGERIGLDRLEEVLRHRRGSDSVSATLRADKRLDYEFILGIIVKVRGSGIETVNLSYERE